MTRVEITQQRWRTTLTVTLAGPGAQRWDGVAAQRMVALADRVEVVASRFRTDSALSAVNAGSGRWVSAPALLVQLVEVALSAAQQTDGMVTPCVGAHVDAAGYRAWRAGSARACLGEDPGPVPAWQDVQVRRDAVRVPPGCQLDLGATAKAWLADELAESLAESTGLGVVANMGGDLRVVATCEQVVGVDHEVPGLAAPAVLLQDAGLATSGQGRRRWVTPRGPRHHVIDPRSGTSARTRWWAVSVVAATATAANVAATASLLADGAGPGWLAHRGLPGLLTCWDGRGSARQEAVGGWPQDREVA